MAFFRRQKPPTREQSLTSIPVRNESVQEERTDDGNVRLIIPTRDDWWVKAASRVFYMPKLRRLALDEMGSVVWELCNGKCDPTTGQIRGNDMRQIIRAFAKRYKLHRKEAEVSVVAHLRNLAKRHLIAVAIPKQTPDQAEARP